MASDSLVRLLDVCIEVGLTVEGTPTVEADEGAGVGMRVHVFIQPTGPREGSGTREASRRVRISAEEWFDVTHGVDDWLQTTTNT